MIASGIISVLGLFDLALGPSTIDVVRVEAAGCGHCIDVELQRGLGFRKNRISVSRSNPILTEKAETGNDVPGRGRGRAQNV